MAFFLFLHLRPLIDGLLSRLTPFIFSSAYFFGPLVVFQHLASKLSNKQLISPLMKVFFQFSEKKKEKNSIIGKLDTLRRRPGEKDNWSHTTSLNTTPIFFQFSQYLIL